MIYFSSAFLVDFWVVSLFLCLCLLIVNGTDTSALRLICEN